MDFTDPDTSIVNADLTGLPPTALHYGEYQALAGEGADLGRRIADFEILSEVRPLPEVRHSFILGGGARARGGPGDRACPEMRIVRREGNREDHAKGWLT